ncbi:MAG: hypothetical protein Q7J65_05355 [Candidatus Marinimicrobia bacterium]|nr:hypothetical protein [Candidatus Neomarinimicrobiota bacterium]
MKPWVRHLIIVSFLFYLNGQILSASENMVIVIIDGARYSETFGDTSHQYIPNMWNISANGTIIDEFYNDSMTYTSKAIPALWCGAWTETVDTVNNGYNTQYAAKPSIFEYYRKQKNIPMNKCRLTAYQAFQRGGIVRVEVRDERILLRGNAVTVFSIEIHGNALSF